MLSCTGPLRPLAAALAFLALAVWPVSPVSAFPNEEAVGQNGRIAISIYGFYADTLSVSGTSRLSWTDWYFNGSHWIMDAQIMSLDVSGSTEGPEPDIFVALNPAMPSLGQVVSLDGGDWPAESFFDVWCAVHVPAVFPGEALVTQIPIHMSATIDHMPPFFDPYTAMAGQTIPLFDQSGIERGAISYWVEKAIPYTPPRADICIAVSKGGEVAIVEDGFVAVKGSVTGGLEPLSAEFGVRPTGSGLPFSTFWLDPDGSARRYATVRPVGSGDGWRGYLNVAPYPPAGVLCDFEVRFHFAGGPDLCDTSTVFVDPTPPIPWFISIQPDSAAYFRPDSLYEITVTTGDEDALMATLLVFPIPPEKHRVLIPTDQNMLGTPWDSMGCVPAAVASCLKYFADNGYPKLDNPQGDESQPDEGTEEMAEELGQDMGTDESGTDEDEMKSGTEDYLGDHGCSGWDVDVEPVNGYDDVAKMLDEFAADGEDVIILTESVNSDGDTVGHAVTMGSEESYAYEVVTPEAFIGCIGNNLDFMDPDGGSGTEENTYGVTYDANGNPVLAGYTGAGDSDARITGYMKVSPPGSGAGAKVVSRGPAGVLGDWIIVSSTPMRGNGLPDTLAWDTSSFPGGVYLLVVRTMDASGNVGRDLRLSFIPEYTVDADAPDTPKPMLDLKGPYPNPFNPVTTVEYTIPADGPVNLAIFDVSGRLVRTLVGADRMKAGTYTASWNGMNEAGTSVASGVYVCRLRSASGVASVKLVLVR